MLELLIAFGAGAVASSWVHLKNRRRKGSVTSTRGGVRRPAISNSEILASPKMRAAVIVMSLSPELSARLFQEFSPEAVQKVTDVIAELPVISADLRTQVLDEFAASLGISAHRLEEAAREEPALIARGLTNHFKL